MRLLANASGLFHYKESESCGEVVYMRKIRQFGEEYKKVRLTLRLPKKLDSLIRKEAQERNLSINQVMVKILNDAL